MGSAEKVTAVYSTAHQNYSEFLALSAVGAQCG